MAESSLSVQDAPDGAYLARAVVDASALHSIREANLAFLTLLAQTAVEGTEHFGLPATVGERARALEPAARVIAADCPYTLFDLRFADTRFWRERALAGAAPAGVDAGPPAAFARAAVFLAWHLVHSNELAAALAFGMGARAQRVWKGLPVSALEDAARLATPHLAARWPRHPTFWTRLLESAPDPAGANVEAVRLLGLQLIAADEVWPAPSLAGAPVAPA